jgi:hypothetical protein
MRLGGLPQGGGVARMWNNDTWLVFIIVIVMTTLALVLAVPPH